MVGKPSAGREHRRVATSELQVPHRGSVDEGSAPDLLNGIDQADAAALPQPAVER